MVVQTFRPASRFGFLEWFLRMEMRAGPSLGTKHLETGGEANWPVCGHIRDSSRREMAHGPQFGLISTVQILNNKNSRSNVFKLPFSYYYYYYFGTVGNVHLEVVPHANVYTKELPFLVFRFTWCYWYIYKRKTLTNGENYLLPHQGNSTSPFTSFNYNYSLEIGWPQRKDDSNMCWWP